jgi:hypothetical protein
VDVEKVVFVYKAEEVVGEDGAAPRGVMRSVYNTALPKLATTLAGAARRRAARNIFFWDACLLVQRGRLYYRYNGLPDTKWGSGRGKRLKLSSHHPYLFSNNSSL